MSDTEVQISWHSYPSIFNLGHAAIKELFFDDVLVEEKVDGSQFSFGKFGDKILVRSKGKQLDIDAPEKMFTKAVETVLSLDLKDGWTYRAEYLKTPKHNSLAYSRIPNKHLIIFDINTGQEEYLRYYEKREEAARLGLEMVPMLHIGKIDGVEDLKAFMERDSILGGQTIEGFVVKNYSRFGKDKKALMGKYVSEVFKEMNHKNWKKDTKKEIGQRIIDFFKTNARWDKAVQHFRDNGDLENSPRDIGKLFKEIHVDIEKECSEEIKNILYKEYIGNIKRGVCAGLPEWYKEKLMESQFDSELEIDTKK